MAETAKILNPTKIVVMPDLDAGCCLADRCPARTSRAWLKQYPGHDVVSYINCSADVKALSDVIGTVATPCDGAEPPAATGPDRLRPGPPPGQRGW